MSNLSWSPDLYEAVKLQKAAKSASAETLDKLSASERKALTLAFRNRDTAVIENDWF